MSNNQFNELGLSENMLKCLDSIGFIKSTDVQSKAIPLMLQNRDITVQAPTGTGKTLAFGIPCIESIDPSSKAIQALVLCPTRELAIQTANVLQKLVKYKPGVKIVAIYGGERIEKQLMALRRYPQIVVATPGRMCDHMQRKSLRIDNLKLIVLDEADRMLDMGFRDDLNSILETVPQQRQTALFSATLSPEIKQIAKTYQTNAAFVKIEQETLTVASVEQFFTEIRGKTKTPALINLLAEKRFYLSLVFVGTKIMADQLSSSLSSSGIKAEALHGDLRQRQRDIVMDKFRRGEISVLIATDVAARGIDVTNIDAVVNYDIPQDSDSYVHRIGRTGRADKSGVAYTFIYPKERQKLRQIIFDTKAVILPMEISIEKMEYIPEKKAIAAPKIEKKIKPEVVSEKSELANMFISIGRKDSVTPKSILDLINANCDIGSTKIGKITIFDNYSFFEIPHNHAKQVIADLCGISHNRRTVIVEISGRTEESSEKPFFKKKREQNRRSSYKAS